MYFYFKILLHCFCDRETWTFNSAPTEGALYVKHPFLNQQIFLNYLRVITIWFEQYKNNQQTKQWYVSINITIL